ncbi:hypothetical protein QU24_20295 [Pantoea rodasii]|uniref:Multidrug resistance-like ATP-binding protein MdlB n=1 Tax=Pantoea rodasii TaxID=1076549 RepID=A0A0B1R3I2_9GAMM|nr:ATP-binding cassette domain-containing protein [Pantoea rodasii]KHJ66231.1 hypothetical protein QU24_20295 [Pantoea rodasii]
MKAPLSHNTSQLFPSLSLNLLSGVVITGSYLFQALLFTRLIMASPSATASDLTLFIVLLVGNVLLRAVMMGLRSLQSEQLAASIRGTLRGQLFHPLLAPGYGVMQQHDAAALRATVIEGVEVMEGYYSRYLPAVLFAVASSVLTVALLISFDGLSGFLLLVSMVLCPTIDHLFMRHQRHHIVGVFAAMQQFAAELMDALRGMLTLKACNAVPRFRARLASHAASLRHESMSTLRVTMMRGGITRLIALLSSSGLLILNAWRAAEGHLDAGILILTLFICWEAFRPILQLETVIHTLWAAQEMRPAIQALAASPLVINDPESPQPLPDSHTLHFSHVTFRWPGQNAPLFQDLSFSIKEKCHTAFIGPSGSGKSSLIQLITRFVSPEKGTILLGDQPINHLSIAALRSRISWVSQQVFLIDGTLAENLRLANPDASEQALWRALQQAQLAEWVQGLPQQFNTLIGENGGLLSGGQRQRLAIARALLKQSPILILDEVTSNLDVANEAALAAMFTALQGKCTLISIAHRLETVAQADHLVVLQDGKILEQGSPLQLSRSQGYNASRLHKDVTP